MKQDNSTFEPSQHFLTLIKQHQTDIACEKLKGETVVQIHRKKKCWQGFWTSYGSDIFITTFP